MWVDEYGGSIGLKKSVFDIFFVECVVSSCDLDRLGCISVGEGYL